MESSKEDSPISLKSLPPVIKEWVESYLASKEVASIKVAIKLMIEWHFEPKDIPKAMAEFYVEQFELKEQTLEFPAVISGTAGTIYPTTKSYHTKRLVEVTPLLSIMFASAMRPRGATIVWIKFGKFSPDKGFKLMDWRLSNKGTPHIELIEEICQKIVFDWFMGDFNSIY